MQPVVNNSRNVLKKTPNPENRREVKQTIIHHPSQARCVGALWLSLCLVPYTDDVHIVFGFSLNQFGGFATFFFSRSINKRANSTVLLFGTRVSRKTNRKKKNNPPMMTTSQASDCADASKWESNREWESKSKMKRTTTNNGTVHRQCERHFTKINRTITTHTAE